MPTPDVEHPNDAPDPQAFAAFVSLVTHALQEPEKALEDVHRLYYSVLGHLRHLGHPQVLGRFYDDRGL